MSSSVDDTNIQSSDCGGHTCDLSTHQCCNFFACAPLDATCCSNTQGYCPADHAECCGQECCASNETCCQGTSCAPEGGVCCSTDSAGFCTNPSGCCTNGCCPQGSNCLNGSCCPVSQACEYGQPWSWACCEAGQACTIVDGCCDPAKVCYGECCTADERCECAGECTCFVFEPNIVKRLFRKLKLLLRFIWKRLIRRSK